MPEFKLKAGQERFRVVDGPFRKKLYEPGVSYFEIPPEEAHRFEEVKPEIVATPATKKTKPAAESEEGNK